MQNKPKSLKDYTVFAEAWLCLALARCMLLFFPFKKIVPVLGTANGKPGEGRPLKPETIGLICLSIGRACRFSPWRTKCFEQAMAAKMILHRRHANYTIFFGVYRNIEDTRLIAHAWLESNGAVITGAGGLDRYTVVGSFTG